MLLKKEFESTVNRLGLDTEVDRCLAEIVWERCEAAHASRSPQTAVLLKTKLDRIERNTVLSKSEIQFLTSVLAKAHTWHDGVRKDLAQIIQNHWMLCDPEDETTKETFKQMNKWKNSYRKSKEEFKKLAKIQHKLKKMR